LFEWDVLHACEQHSGHEQYQNSAWNGEWSADRERDVCGTAGWRDGADLYVERWVLD
jgi:hypothetical protein